MISAALINELHCPYCGSALALEPLSASDSAADAVVRCACYRYPVLSGILILRQLSGLADNRDPIVERLEARDRAGALGVALRRLSSVQKPRSLPRRAWDALLRAPAGPLGRRLSAETERRASSELVQALELSPTFQDAAYRLRPEGFAEYLYSRQSNPSYLSALALLLALSRAARPGRLLDLACGTGHSTFALSTLLPGSTLFAADHDFVNLCLVQRFQAPDAVCICIDAELPLPFADGWFQTVFCLDAFHYIRSKVALVRELERVMAADGLWMFPHLHNARGHNPNAGVALERPDYARVFSSIAPRIFDELKLLGQYVELDAVELGPGLDGGAEPATLTLVADGSGRAFGKHEGLAERLLARPDRLGLNPMYRATPSDGKLSLELRTLTPDLADECALGLARFEQRLTLDAGLLGRLRSSRASSSDFELARRLVRGFVLVPLPDRYSAEPGAGAGAAIGRP
jgi:SAM-dependent methyltransferase